MRDAGPQGEPLERVHLAGAGGVQATRLAERGEVAATSMAITVIGFNRLESITRRFLFLEFERLSTVSAFEEPSLFEVSAPDAPSVGRLSSRYAALG
jgi:hypothetical protein